MRAKNAPFVLDNWRKKKSITYFFEWRRALTKDQYIKLWGCGSMVLIFPNSVLSKGKFLKRQWSRGKRERQACFHEALTTSDRRNFWAIWCQQKFGQNYSTNNRLRAWPKIEWHICKSRRNLLSHQIYGKVHKLGQRWIFGFVGKIPINKPSLVLSFTVCLQCID